MLKQKQLIDMATSHTIKTARNFNPNNVYGRREIISSSKNILEPNEINPEHVITPGIFVQSLINIENPIIETNAIEEGMTYP